MEFSINLAKIIDEMGNEAEETISELLDAKTFRKLVQMVGEGKIKLRIGKTSLGYYLIINVPDEWIYGRGGR